MSAAAPQTSIVVHVPDAAAGASQPGSAAKTRSAGSRLFEPESASTVETHASSGREHELAPGNLRTPLERVRSGDVDDVDTAKERYRRRWKDKVDEDDGPRPITSREIADELEYDRVERNGPPLDLAGAKLQGPVIAGPDEQRRHREQREAERRRREDEDFVATIEKAWQSRGLKLTVAAEVELAKLKRGGAS